MKRLTTVYSGAKRIRLYKKNSFYMVNFVILNVLLKNVFNEPAIQPKPIANITILTIKLQSFQNITYLKQKKKHCRAKQLFHLKKKTYEILSKNHKCTRNHKELTFYSSLMSCELLRVTQFFCTATT